MKENLLRLKELLKCRDGCNRCPLYDYCLFIKNNSLEEESICEGIKINKSPM